jgi:single-strand DNA-binding protein
MLNRVIIMGRLTADPELRQTQNGVNTCQITVAVNRNYAAQGQERQADFINVVAWRQTAEFISKYFSKGKMIIVEGSLRTRTYDDKRYPDVKHYVTEVYADNVSFGESKSAQNNSQPVAQAQNVVQPNVQAAFNQPVAQATMDSRGNVTVPPINLGDLDVEVVNNGDLPF